MILYHGSQRIVAQPQYGLGSPNNDYGLGFYCTKELELVREWACPAERDGFSNKYELDMTGLTVLDLNGGRCHILNWIALLLKNRSFEKRSPISRQASVYLLDEFLPELSGADVVCGYRADDSYFAYAKDFLNNTISVAQLAQAMKLGKLGEQVVLTSRQSFEQIRFLEYEIADAGIYYARRAQREERARIAYLHGHGADFALHDDDLFIRDILQQRVKNDDPRLL